ncbi:hypothetical protein ACO0M4_10105 [Streptomyces sp. RGM 3693]
MAPPEEDLEQAGLAASLPPKEPPAGVEPGVSYLRLADPVHEPEPEPAA